MVSRSLDTLRLTVDVVDLSRPEQKQDEEIAPAEECDQQDQDHRPLRLREDLLGYHRVLCELDLPDEESYNQDEA